MALLYDTAAPTLYLQDSTVPRPFIYPVLHRIQGPHPGYAPLELDARNAGPALARHTSSSSTTSQAASSTSSVPSLSSCTTISLSTLDDHILSPRVPGTSEKGRCPYPQCGKIFKDIKAHMLTHQAERPEKCPVLTCEYHQKGFARKYDSNRHTLTHYKEEIVCGFCPGPSAANNRTFNRVDVLKRHLTSVHGVEQLQPNARRSIPANSSRKLSDCSDESGICSICQTPFINAQAFYMHLDGCVLRAVQEQQNSNDCLREHEEDAEKRQASMRDGPGWKVAAGREPDVAASPATLEDQPRKNAPAWSKGNMPLVGKNRKRKKQYPPSWGMSAEKMSMKKRVICVYDDERRLWKDDMISPGNFKMNSIDTDEGDFVTRFDQDTMERAAAFHMVVKGDHYAWTRGWLQEHIIDDMSNDGAPEAPSDPAKAERTLREMSNGQFAEMPDSPQPVLSKAGERRANSCKPCLDSKSKCSGGIPCTTCQKKRQKPRCYYLGALLLDTRHQEFDALPAPQVELRNDKNYSPCTPQVSSAAQITEHNPKLQPPDSIHSLEEGVHKDISVNPAGSFQKVEPIAQTKTGDFAKPNPLAFASEDFRTNSSNIQGSGPENGFDRSGSALDSDGDATTPSPTEDDGSRRLRLEGDEAFESEGELSFMATPGPGDLQLEPDGPLNSLRWVLQNLVAERISHSYTTLLLRGRGAGAQNAGSSGSSKYTSNTTSGFQSSQTTPSSPLSVKKRSCTDDEHENDEGEEPPRKRPNYRREYGAADDGKLLACPYSKYDFARYSERNTIEMQYRGCASCFLTSIPRLKQHLYRVHSRPKHYCSCCFESFEIALLLDAHARARACTVSPSPFDEKMTVDQMTEIKRRTPREERTKSWFAIYSVLFPQAALPTNPFVGNYSEECVEHFLGYFEREAPRVLTNAIRSDLNASALLLGSEQRRMLDDILETSLTRVALTMSNVARQRWDNHRDNESRPATEAAFSPSPSNRLPAHRLRNVSSNSSSSASVSHPSQLADDPPNCDQSELAQDELESTQQWLLVSRQTTQDYESRPVEVATSLSSVNAALPLLSILPECDESTGIDHNMASDEWHELLNNGAPLEFWQVGGLYSDDSNIAAEEVHSTMAWYT